MFNDNLIQEISKNLLQAEDTGIPIEKLSEEYKDISIFDSYRIQEEVVKLKTNRGEKIIGKKIGLTSKGIQSQFGVYEPDYGILTDKGLLKNNQELDISKLNQPKIEAEIVFILKEDLLGPVVTPWNVISATEGIMPALEVVDTRFNDWKIKIFDTVADSASYARIVVGDKMTKIDDIDLSLLGMASYKNGKLVFTAASAEVMGNPINSVVWLANKMIELGQPLKKGEVILSGSLTPLMGISSGDYIQVKFDRIGSVSLNII
jgi:2-oxopent-4-enoate hydratase